METVYLIIIIATYAALFLFGVVGSVISMWIVSGKVFRNYFVKGVKEGWGHYCSDKTNYEQMMMWESGQRWAKEHIGKKSDVHIENEGYNLYGEYYDFGSKRTVIIVPGRTESWEYSYYFAEAYKGFNVLVIDVRSHGYSDGKYEDCGYNNHKDLIAWSKYLHEEFGCDDISFHGICIGSCGSTFAAASKECPSYVTHIVLDGMFTTYRETFKNHMKDMGRPTFLVLDFIMLRAKMKMGVHFNTDGPIKQIRKIDDKAVLFIYTKKDRYSLPKDGQRMYELCPSRQKKIAFFEEGVHSHVRINAEELYDKTIADFFEEAK